jgi:hypothetical protein
MSLVTSGLAVCADLFSSFGRPVFGEVQVGELAEELDGLGVIGVGNLDLVSEEAEPDSLALKSDLGESLLATLEIPHAFEHGDRTCVLASVPHILPARADATVSPCLC